MTEPAVPVVKTEGFSPKMLAATAATTVIGVIIAVLNLLQTSPSLLGGLPTWLQSVILIIIPPVLAGFTAYQASPGSVSVTSDRS